HREVAVALLIEDLHAAQLGHGRSPRRDLAEPAVAQSFSPFFLIAQQQPAEMPSRHAQHLTGLFGRQPPLAVTLHCLFEPEHKHLPQRACPPHRPLQNRGRTWRTTHALRRRTTGPSPTLRSRHLYPRGGQTLILPRLSMRRARSDR